MSCLLIHSTNFASHPICRKSEKSATHRLLGCSKCNALIVSMVRIIFDQILKIGMVAYSYLDLSLDFLLLVTILKVLDSTWKDMDYFASQVTYLLVASILVPGIITAFTIAYKRPLVVLGFDS